MNFNLSPEQQMLADSAERFIREQYPFEVRRTVANGMTGYSDKQWSAMAELGWLMLNVPEAYGGLGSDYADTCILMQALGKGLVSEPLISIGVWAASLIGACDDESIKQNWLEAIACGTSKFAIAHLENGMTINQSINSPNITTRAEKDGDGYVINGQKTVVFDGPVADAFLVTAAENSSGSFSVFLIDKNTVGLTLDNYRLIDGSGASDITFDQCRVAAGNRILAGQQASDSFAMASDRAHLAALASMVGIMEACLELVPDYVKNRKQFGQPIAQFQVIQHTLADMFVAYQESRSILFHALANIDNVDTCARQQALSAAAIVIGEGLQLITEQGIQLHGGYGVTDEYPISHYYRRGLVLQQLVGDGDEHAVRFSATQLSATQLSATQLSTKQLSKKQSGGLAVEP